MKIFKLTEMFNELIMNTHILTTKIVQLTLYYILYHITIYLSIPLHMLQSMLFFDVLRVKEKS